VKKPRITILIPCYNEENSILEVINMVKSVDLGYPKEIIVVDDGSEDSSVEKVRTQSYCYTRRIRVRGRRFKRDSNTRPGTL